MTSPIAAFGSGRSVSFIPAVPVAWLVTTIAFIIHLLASGLLPSSNSIADENTTAKLAGPMTRGYGIDAIKAFSDNRSEPNATVNRSECSRERKKIYRRSGAHSEPWICAT
jgi:hypothetical protein